MSNTLKILILEDDLHDCDCFLKYVQEDNEVEIVGCTGNANEAIRIACEQKPDAAIVDLELHKGGGNGLQFLAEIKQSNPSQHPFLLVTTNNPSRTIHDAARSLGADFILAKYEADYSAEYVIRFLKMMYGTIHASSKNSSFSVITGGLSNSKDYVKDSVDSSAKYFAKDSDDAPSEPVVYTPSSDFQGHSVDDFSEFELLEFIREQMNEIGISPKAVGYRYLTDAVLIKVKDTDANVYSTLGPKYKKSDPSIERAMQYAINRAWRTNDPAELLRIYTARIHSERGVPTIMEFVYFYATKTRNHFKLR